jgi:hypothetical protein
MWRPIVILLAGSMIIGCVAIVPAEPRPNDVDGVEGIENCRAPGRCGQLLGCEGKRLTLSGKVDPVNIFDQVSHSALPFQKFLVRSTPMREPTEVWVVSATAIESQQIFSRVRSAVARDVEIFVMGTAVGVDLQISGACRRVIKLEIQDANAIRVGGVGIQSETGVSRRATK